MNFNAIGRAFSAAVAAALLMTSGAARADGGDAAAGKAVYEQTCLPCHGASGRGNGPAAVALNPKPMDFTDATRMAKVTVDVRRKAVNEGGAAVGASAIMPAFKGALTPKQIDDVLAYISVSFVKDSTRVAQH